MEESRELAERASRGDGEAIDELLTRHLPGLRAFLRLRMGPELRARESVSDLAQSTCREVLEHLDRFRYQGEANFRHWLYATALRKVKNRVEYHQAQKRDHARELRADECLAAVYQTLSTPSRRLMGREEVEALEAAFERLSEPHREVILLARIVGLSHAEIAAATGRSEQATRSLLHRALAELAEEMERPAAPGPAEQTD